MPAGTRDRPWFALIGDIERSRELPDRSGIQERLEATLEALNRRADAGTVAAGLRITAGDEVQGLLARPEYAVDVVVGVEDALRPAHVAWGLGRGLLSTEPGGDVALLDGSCFHRARDALERLGHGPGWLGARGFGDPHDAVLEALFGLLRAVRSRWTDVQARYAREVRGRLQREVADRLGVSEPAVSKGLSAARFAAVTDGEEAARSYLAWLDAGGATSGDGEAV